MSNNRFNLAAQAAIATLLMCTGCIVNVPSDLANLADSIDALVGQIQTNDPRQIDLAGTADDSLNATLDNNAGFVDNIPQDLGNVNLDQTVLLGIENLTGFDIFIGFNVDGEFQGVFVLDGETVLLDYDCFDTLELLFEDDFETDTGVFVDEFDLLDSVFEVTVDFDCGEALIVTFDINDIVAVTQPLN